MIDRAPTGVLLAFVPIYLANIAFAKRFAESADSQSAFGINLLVVVAVRYLAAFVLKPRPSQVRLA